MSKKPGNRNVEPDDENVSQLKRFTAQRCKHQTGFFCFPILTGVINIHALLPNLENILVVMSHTIRGRRKCQILYSENSEQYVNDKRFHPPTRRTHVVLLVHRRNCCRTSRCFHRLCHCAHRGLFSQALCMDTVVCHRLQSPVSWKHCSG